MKNIVEKLLGPRISKFRNEREITQEELAKSVNVTPETISRIERGVAIPSIKTLEKISFAFHISLKDLFDFGNVHELKSSKENECTKLLAYLKSRNANEIKLCYRILKKIFNEIDKNYTLKKK